MGQKMPVIMLSADARSTSIKTCLAAGANVYLTKPIDIKKLAHVLESLIDQTSLPEKKSSYDCPISDIINIEILIDLRNLSTAPSFIRSLVTEYLDASAALLAEMEKAATNDDQAAFRTASHTLKGSSAVLGATMMKEFCAEIDHAMLSKESMQDFLSKIKTIYQPTCTALLDFSAQENS